MKKNKIKDYLKFGILFLGILFFQYSCSESEEENLSIEKEATFFKNISNAPFSEIKNKKFVAKNVKKHLTQGFSKTNSENGFIIDTTMVQVLISELYTNYTFKVEMETEDVNFLTNYVLTIFNDSLYHQMLIRYPIVTGEQISYDTKNAIAEPLEGNMLVQKIGCSGYETTDWEDVSIDHYCASGDHLGARQAYACNYSGSDAPSTTIVGSWVTTCHPALNIIDQGDSGHGGGTTGDGSSSSGTPNTDNPNDSNDLVIGTSPFDGEGTGRRKECRKIKKILENNNSLYMDKVRDLKNKDNLASETSVAIFDDDSIGEYQGVANNSTVQTLPITPLSNYVSMAHVHNENDSIKSYSVPSLGDLQWIARRYKDGHLNTSEFTAFLATADGTYFALTINNPTKLWEFFRYINAANFNITVEERKEAAQKLKEVYKPILKKYYYDEQSALIKENAQGAANNEQQLVYFLRFLEDADAGITVFESDENFSTFTKLSIKGFDVKRSTIPCTL